MTAVTLTRGEQWIAKQTDLEGVAAEIAFGRMRNLFPDLSIGPRSGGPDFIGRDGSGIDVKTTTYDDGQLIATPKKAGDDGVDWYVLMVGTFPGPYEFKGYASREELFLPENLTDLGHGPTYALPQSALHKPSC